jgi:hypothetical protein
VKFFSADCARSKAVINTRAIGQRAFAPSCSSCNHHGAAPWWFLSSHTNKSAQKCRCQDRRHTLPENPQKAISYQSAVTRRGVGEVNRSDAWPILALIYRSCLWRAAVRATTHGGFSFTSLSSLVLPEPLPRPEQWPLLRQPRPESPSFPCRRSLPRWLP